MHAKLFVAMKYEHSLRLYLLHLIAGCQIVLGICVVLRNFICKLFKFGTQFTMCVLKSACRCNK